ncbi:hypothetical protein N510_000055 [Firmicutes bacterium ASF500]|nr:hypothetical protein N510_000055 [Firmicutes bacterium ASF500]
MAKPLISVIIPVYKVEAYLERCMETVVHQSYRNLEIILVDDGSPDRCPAMCDAWARRDGRIQVIHKANGGLSEARNWGLRAASGTYISFVDSDDWLSLVMLERMEEAMEAYGTDMVICQFVYVKEDGLCEKSVEGDYPDEVLSAREAVKLLLEDTRVTSHVWRKLYKRELIPADVFPVGRNYEDIFVMHRLILKCRSVVCLNSAYYFYRYVPQGIVRSRSPETLRSYLEGHRIRRRELLESVPDLREQIDLGWARGVLTIWQSLKELDKGQLRPLREEVKRELSGIRAGAVMRTYPNRWLRLRLDGLVVKLCPWAEGAMYRLLLSDRSPGGRAGQRCRYVLGSAWSFLRLCREHLGRGKAFWIFCVPEYGNLGDQALLLAEEALIRRYFPECRICEAPLYQPGGRLLARLVRPGSFCAIQGGGNFGTMYPGIHRTQESMIYALRRRRVFVFPQTVFYGGAQGEQMLQQTRRVYKKCGKLCIFARERTSYEFLREQFPDTASALMPDMALFLPPVTSGRARRGALLGIRPDGERTITDRDYGRVLSLLEERFGRVEDFDTHVYRDLSPEEAKRELAALWDRMAGAEVVVTDRLHGMIFAAMTQTPCVLLPSRSHKIEGVYQWLAPLPYVRLCRDMGELEDALNQVLSCGRPVYALEETENMFREMAGIIRGTAER